MANTYVILGRSGLIGTAVYNKLSDSSAPYRIFAFDHPQADISNKSHVAPLIKYTKPSVVINCAAVNDIDLCEDAKAGAYTVNAVGPEILAAECEKIGAKLVTFSSSTVFDGKRAAAYSEKCATAPVNVHGQSKLEGERAVAKLCKDHLIIRPGWVFHYEGDNCVTDWVSKADRKMPINIRGDLQGSPTYIPDLADAVVELIRKEARGTFHVANRQAATWSSFADAVVGLTKNKTYVNSCSGSLRAPMPANAVLSMTKYSETTGKQMRPWMEALQECLFEMHRYKP